MSQLYTVAYRASPLTSEPDYQAMLLLQHIECLDVIIASCTRMKLTADIFIDGFRVGWVDASGNHEVKDVLDI